MLKNFLNSLCFCNGKNNVLLNNNIKVPMNTNSDKLLNNKKEKKSSKKFINTLEYNTSNIDKNISTEITNESKNALKNQELKAKIINTTNNKKEEQAHKSKKSNKPSKKNQLSTKISEEKKNDFQSKKILNSKKEKKEFENFQKSINDIVYSNLDDNSESADDSSD